MKKTYFLLIAVSILFTNVLVAQNILPDTNKNRAYFQYGIEPGLSFVVGFQKNIQTNILSSPITTFAEWKVAQHKLNNSELKIGGILPIFSVATFKIVNNLNFSVGNLETVNFDSQKFAIADEIAVGIYKANWFITGTFEYEHIYLNYIEHSDLYKRNYYEDAVDGWYKGAGSTIQLGFELGATIKKCYDIYIELKAPFTGKFGNNMGSPAHLNLGLAYRF